MSTWPRGAAALLSKLDELPRSRSELIELSGVDPADWDRGIDFLLDEGMARRSGTKRGTRYQRSGRGRTLFDREPPAPEPKTLSPSIAVKYHSLVDEVLSELDAPASGRTTDARGTASNAADRSVTPVSKNSASGIRNSSRGSDVVDALRARGIVEIIDHRDKGGCLWIIDGPGVGRVLETVASKFGLRIHHKAEGSRATSGRTAWWTR